MQLVVQSGAEPGRTYDLAAGRKIMLGRQSGNDVVVPDEQVSRKHAEVEHRDGSLIVTDLNSSNGTFVNGTRIGSPQTLRNGDTVQVGTTVLKVTQVQGAASPQPSGYEQPAAGASAFSPGYLPTTNLSGSSQNQPYAPASDYGQAQQAQAQNYSQPAAQPGYASSAQGYGQADYGQAPAPAQNYGQPAGYSPSPDYGQAPAQGYAQADYGQAPPQGYPAQGSYGGQQVYAQPAAAPAPIRAKKNNLLPILIGVGVLALLAIAALAFFLTQGGAGGGGTGDLPAPRNASKVNVERAELERALRQSSPNLDLSKFNLGFYTSRETAANIVSFYKTEMEGKQWTTATAAGNNAIFIKGDQTAAVSVQENITQSQIDAAAKESPAFRDKVKVGDTVITLIQGPTTAFTGASGVSTTAVPTTTRR